MVKPEQKETPGLGQNRKKEKVATELKKRAKMCLRRCADICGLFQPGAQEQCHNESHSLSDTRTPTFGRLVSVSDLPLAFGLYLGSGNL